jgi:hypothetical protein
MTGGPTHPALCAPSNATGVSRPIRVTPPSVIGLPRSRPSYDHAGGIDPPVLSGQCSYRTGTCRNSGFGGEPDITLPPDDDYRDEARPHALK